MGKNSSFSSKNDNVLLSYNDSHTFLNVCVLFKLKLTIFKNEKTHLQMNTFKYNLNFSKKNCHMSNLKKQGKRLELKTQVYIYKNYIV